MGRTCCLEQRDSPGSHRLAAMQIQPIKMIVGGVWALAVFAIAMAFDVSGLGVLAVAAFALLPPLALLLLWNEPAQTMSESINQARR